MGAAEKVGLEVAAEPKDKGAKKVGEGPQGKDAKVPNVVKDAGEVGEVEEEAEEDVQEGDDPLEEARGPFPRFDWLKVSPTEEEGCC